MAVTLGTVYMATKAQEGDFPDEEPKPAEECPEKPAAPTSSPDIDPADISGKSPEEIEELAIRNGLIPKGTDPKSGKGSWVDPVTGEQRILSHPNGEPFPHAHVNNPSGQRLGPGGQVVEPEAPSAHLPLRGTSE